MDKKFRLTLSMDYDNEVLAHSVVSGLIFGYFLDELRDKLAEIDGISKSDIYEALQNIASDGARVDYTSLKDWTENKDFAKDQLLALTVILDQRFAEANGNAGEVVAEVSKDLSNFTDKIAKMEFANGFVSTKESGVNEEIISDVLDELRLVSENEFLVSLMGRDLSFEPLQTKSYTNAFIEKKLKKLDSICSKLSSKIDNDYASLEDMVLDIEKRLYKVATNVSTDGEKAEMTNKILKGINVHKQLIDKVEDGLVEATELSRQLTIHEGKLKEADVKKLEENRIASASSEEANKDLLALRVLNSQYRNQIEKTKMKLDTLKLKLEKHRKVVDGVDLALKSAIPSEAELKKYTSIKHRLQDLQNRLEIAGSQVVLNSESKEVLTANKSGLEALIQIYIDGKDVFMRNALLSGIFSSANALYSLGENDDKVIEKSNKKFIGTKLLEYSIKNSNLQKDFRTFRKVGDEVIRDVAIVFGKPITLGSLKEMAEIQELAINQSSQMLEMIEKNHKSEVEILTSILKI